jgi:hypothetical protein
MMPPWMMVAELLERAVLTDQELQYLESLNDQRADEGATWEPTGREKMALTEVWDREFGTAD